MENLRDLFPFVDIPQTPARFNVAPTQQVLVVRRQQNDGPSAALLRWGLIPPWAKEKKIGASLINARADSVATKPAFRAAFKRRRCLVLADGFYEWPKEDKKTPRQAYLFRRSDGRPFAFAGLWEQWSSADEAVESCTIITTDANAVVRPFHDRMPVMMDAADFERWLDPAYADAAGLQALLRPYPSEFLASSAVGSHVNNARNEGPDCQPTLF